MAAKPWMTSNDLIEAVKRKISFPIAENTYTDDDILKFANDEMDIAQVPTILEYHQEYLVASLIYPLRSDTNRYPVPNRAIGMKVRDVAWVDSAGNLFEMTRIQADDKAFFQRSIGANQAVHKLYIEGDYLVLTPSPVNQPSGSLVIYYFMEPNRLVKNERAAIIESFSKTLTVDNSSLTAGDTVTISSVNQNIYYQPTTPSSGGPIVFTSNEFQDQNVFQNQPIVTTTVFTAVSGSPGANEFQIGATSIATATNLASAINAADIGSASNGNPATEDVVFTYDNVQTKIESSSTGVGVSSNTVLNCDSVHSEMTEGELVDLIQTDAGHRNLAIDLRIPRNGVSSNSITLSSYVVPPNLVVGDYVCLARECIIPQIPNSLHTGLAERVCAQILEGIGDQLGLQAKKAKVGEINENQGMLLDNRVEGSPQKITGRHGLLRYFKTGVRRRV